MTPHASIHLTVDERATLEAWASPSPLSTCDGHTSKRAMRAAIILAAAEGRELHVRPSTANKWRQRFVQERLAGLDDRPRSGAPRRITEELISDVLRKTLEPTPFAARPWSRRTMSRATGLSRSTIDRIWNRFDIAPNRPTSGQ